MYVDLHSGTIAPPQTHIKNVRRQNINVEEEHTVVEVKEQQKTQY